MNLLKILWQRIEYYCIIIDHGPDLNARVIIQDHIPWCMERRFNIYSAKSRKYRGMFEVQSLKK